EEGLKKTETFLSTYHEIDKDILAPYLYRYVGEDALSHLFKVASGLDSQVLGETQVLGQVRQFYEEAKRYGYTDDLLDGAFNAAIEVGKLVRVKTKISEGRVSIGNVATALIKKEIKELRYKKVLIIGLGKISNLVIKYLAEEGLRAIIVSNRTYEKAVKMAESICGRAIRFNKLKKYLKDADIVISATSSPHVILKKEDILEALSFKPKALSQKLLIIDLALPRDIDPNVKNIEGVRLFNLDDLKSVVGKNIEKRNLEAVRAGIIIEQEVKRLWGRFIESERERVPLP
ncbi:MAG: glutamyl-tRNA reductase, partial [Candidatus Omnitrophica bacterium]|nr:glutamyl-tRNA reductase [Candidatus Omnitrophota bacterium]